MSEVILEASDAPAIPVHPILASQIETAIPAEGMARALALAADFKGKTGQLLVVPNGDGTTREVLFGLGDAANPMAFRALPAKLPAGVYRIARTPEGLDAGQIALAF